MSISMEYSLIARKALLSDLSDMVALSRVKRLAYENAQPQFWKHSDGAEDIQSKWFNDLLRKEDYIILVTENHDAINGFIIGILKKHPKATPRLAEIWPPEIAIEKILKPSFTKI